MNFSAFVAYTDERPTRSAATAALVRTLPFKTMKRDGYRQQGLPLDVRVDATSLVDGHVVYHCTMESVVTKRSWVVSYRYSEFHAFKSRVDELYTCHSSKCAGSCQAIRDYMTACFPRKRVMLSTSSSVVEDRKRKLENVLLHLLRCALLPGSAMTCITARHNLPPQLFEFLGVECAEDRRSLLQIYVDNQQELLKPRSSSSSFGTSSSSSSSDAYESSSEPATPASYASTWDFEDDSTCVICLDDLATHDDESSCCAHASPKASSTVTLPCHHSFHRECVFEWLLFQFHCPLCRSRIGPQAVTNYCRPKGCSLWWLGEFEEDPLALSGSQPQLEPEHEASRSSSSSSSSSSSPASH
ncbi:hypothetical protein P43SY_001093 [Pythium insidiosum]|uniref:RING-type domain-containing protein n=1 Tax=Pythium insidiosum TaxID=114742 RepID=A0AAD5LV78_PYTIN|nr:hypothetical protein P43SY_001093 [Pythium insidiosum]